MTTTDAFRDVSNEVLRAALHEAVATERNATARVIALIAEFDARHLYFDEGFNSLFAYVSGAFVFLKQQPIRVSRRRVQRASGRASWR